MNEPVFSFLDAVLQRYLGPHLGSCPRMRRADLERLLTDDTQRRLDLARLAAMDWGRTEIIGNAGITSECLLITPRGLLYAARLSQVMRTPSRHPGPPAGPLYYLATPPALFDAIVERASAAQPLPARAAAVDSRFGHDLIFTWPLDLALRRALDAHEVLRLDPSGYSRLAL